MILFRETDDQAATKTIRLSHDGCRVLVDTYLDGERYLGAKEYTAVEWSAHYRGLLRDGYTTSECSPDLRVTINKDRELCVAGFITNGLREPGSQDYEDDDPAPALIDQADDQLADDGYLRITGWWGDGNGGMTAVATLAQKRSSTPLPVQAATRHALGEAMAAIRGAMDPCDPADTLDWVTLCTDPFDDDLPHRITAIQSRRAANAAVNADGETVDRVVAPALRLLFIALYSARLSDIASCLTRAKLVGTELRG